MAITRKHLSTMTLAIGGLAAVIVFGSCSGTSPVPPPPRPNLAWTMPKAYVPTPDATISLAFGINDFVDELPSGALPITVTKTVINTGSAAIAAGYEVEETVRLMRFFAVAGQAGYVPADTVFSCTQPGPALAPGDSAAVTFVLGGPGCPLDPAFTFAVLPCGVYQETLALDRPMAVDETVEFDNDAVHYFYIPSPVLAININTTRNPNTAPNTFVVGQTVKIRGFEAPPVVTTHGFATSIVGPPGSTYLLNGRSPRTGASGTNCVLAPMMPVLGAPPGSGIPGPQAVSYTCTIPDPAFLGPVCNSFLGNVPVFEENLNTKLTAISADGCIIRQKSGLVSVVFECNP